MHEITAEHPSLALLEAFDRGRLSLAEWAAAQRHLLGCPDCARRVEGLPKHALAALLHEYRPHCGGEEGGGPLPASQAAPGQEDPAAPAGAAAESSRRAANRRPPKWCRNRSRQQ